MSIPDTIIEAQIKRLLEVVEDYRSKHCQDILEQARLDARDIILTAYKTARQRLHQDVLESRERVKQELAAARAKQHTLDKHQQYKVNRQFLDRAWERLIQQMERRWRTATHRRLWVNMVLNVARQHLPVGQWQIEYPPDWIQDERNELEQQVLQHTGVAPQLQPYSDIKAGVRISANGAVVNGTISGLTTDRTRIEAELLALSEAKH